MREHASRRVRQRAELRRAYPICDPSSPALASWGCSSSVPGHLVMVDHQVALPGGLPQDQNTHRAVRVNRLVPCSGILWGLWGKRIWNRDVKVLLSDHCFSSHSCQLICVHPTWPEVNQRRNIITYAKVRRRTAAETNWCATILHVTFSGMWFLHIYMDFFLHANSLWSSKCSSTQTLSTQVLSLGRLVIKRAGVLEIRKDQTIVVFSVSWLHVECFHKPP